MSSPRYLAILGFGDPDATRAMLQAARRDHGLAPVFQAAGVQVLASPELPAIVIGSNQGVVLGDLFKRSHEAAAERSAARATALQRGPISALLDSHWGSYVAISATFPSAVEILRDPSAGVGCYWTRRTGAVFVFDDVALAKALGLISGEPDIAGVVQSLAYPYPRDARTGLVGIAEVLPGTAIQVGADGRVTDAYAWTPGRFTARERQLSDPNTAAKSLRAEAQRAVTAWASGHRSIVLELSGGLDSSIVAACLAQRTRDLHLVTLVTPDPGADERDYAQAVAQRLGLPLHALSLEVANARLEPQRRLTARPRGGLLHRLIDEALTAHAQAVGADGFFSGGGGDNVFCYLATAAPATDALLRRGPGPAFWHAVADLAAVHGCTVWEAGGLAVRKAWRPTKDRPPQSDFLALEALPPPPAPHPWLAWPDLLPGQREHLFSLVAVQRSLFDHDRETLAPIRFPLLSQPLVELCLQIPSWMWIAGGQDRAVARAAFAYLLPPSVLQRRTKGDFMGLLGALYRKHRAELLPLLLDGWLAHHRLIDRPRIEAYLRSTAPVSDVRFFRLLELANVELWVRSWLARGVDLAGR